MIATLGTKRFLEYFIKIAISDHQLLDWLKLLSMELV